MKTFISIFTMVVVAILVSCNNASNSSTNDKSIENDFDSMLDDITKLHQEYMNALAVASQDYGGIKNLEKPRLDYWNALDKAYKKEIMYLVTSDDENAADRVVFLLQEIPIDGEKKDGIIHYNDSSYGAERIQGLRAYTTYVEHYNRLCDVAFDLAINRKKKQFAANIINCYKPDVVVTKGGSGINVNGVKIESYQAYIENIYKSRDAAQEKFEIAVKNGVFE